jgi:hypothetical protein
MSRLAISLYQVPRRSGDLAGAFAVVCSICRRGSGTIAFAAAALPVLAEARIAADYGRALTLGDRAFPERWSYLAGPAQRTERFKYIPLSADGATYLTTGVAQQRLRFDLIFSFP